MSAEAARIPSLYAITTIYLIASFWSRLSTTMRINSHVVTA